MTEPSGHRGTRQRPDWELLRESIKHNQPITLSPAQCRDILDWANELTEDKNAVVRENHALQQPSNRSVR